MDKTTWRLEHLIALSLVLSLMLSSSSLLELEAELTNKKSEISPPTLLELPLLILLFLLSLLWLAFWTLLSKPLASTFQETLAEMDAKDSAHALEPVCVHLLVIPETNVLEELALLELTETDVSMDQSLATMETSALTTIVTQPLVVLQDQLNALLPTSATLLLASQLLDARTH
jgi:hypothetical protein